MTRRTEIIVFVVLACVVTVALSFLLPDGRGPQGPIGLTENSSVPRAVGRAMCCR